MVLTVRHKTGLYRRWNCDIWGLAYTDENCRLVYLNEGKFRIFKDKTAKPLPEFKITIKNFFILQSRVLEFFYKRWWKKRKAWRRKRQRLTYKFNRAPIWYHQYKVNRRFSSIRLTRLYYLTFQDHQFRRIFKRAAKKDGNFEVNYLQYLEGRALAIIYRLNFTPNIFWLMGFIKQNNNFFVEWKPIKRVNTLILIGCLLSVARRWHDKFAKFVARRIKLKTLLFPTPKCIYASYGLFFFYLCRAIQRTDLVYPFALDLQRITGYN